MVQSSPATRRLLVTIILALFILAAFGISGFTIADMDGHQIDYRLPPLQEPEPVDVIVNGDFELPWEDREDVAPEWEAYTNGQAHVGWYEETWPEAVHTGEQAQLMEIFEVDPNVQSRVIAIYQTVDVAPDSTYDLELFAILRSMVQPGDRNKDEFAMHWGVDYAGEGEYENVEEWVFMPLEEQSRLGSTGEYPDDIPLFYERITGTIETGESDKITLFIRGLKKFATPPEVNFDVDDVSLVGPPPGPIVIITPEAPAEDDTAAEEMMPDTGAALPEQFSAGALALGGLVIVVLGVGAAAGLLLTRKET